jgi:type IV pilus biogenesis protein CpaD/CtpE
VDETLTLQTRAQSGWQQQAAAKVARTNAKIPSAWKLSSKVVNAAKQQNAFIGTRNNGKTIEDLINTLPKQAFSSPFSGCSLSWNTAAQVIQITNTDPVDLVKAMENKTYTAVDVVLAFSLRAAVIHQVVSTGNIAIKSFD